LNSFFIPVLSEAVTYRRLSGFFSSSVLAVAARGLARFVTHNGKMELICGAKLSKEDVDAIRKGSMDISRVLEQNLAGEITDIEDKLIRDHVAALGWMIARGNLEIKIAMVLDEDGNPLDGATAMASGIFHQKVGILEDIEGNRISFSGSDNESATAWIRHIEEFKVFRSWIEGEEEYISSDLDKFNKFWTGRGKRTLTIPAPEAIRRGLIEYAPEEFSEQDLTKWTDTWQRIGKPGPRLWAHQMEAVEAWFKNNSQGIFEMATGSGKTIAALECIRRLSKKENRLLTVVTTPYSHLTKQWIKIAESYGICDKPLVADASNPNWKNELADALLDMKNGLKSNIVVFTTHTTFGSSDFTKLISSCAAPAFLVADEVHGIGAPERQNGLISAYIYRLGLSATPKRWFDEEGTTTIYNYFGPVVYEFSLYRGIHEINEVTNQTFLVPYEYLPRFVQLTENEAEEYRSITEKITRKFHAIKDTIKREEALELLYFERAKILDNAIAKYDELKKILSELGEIRNCLIYCSPKQLPIVQDILNEKKIIQHKFTMKEGVVPLSKYGGHSEREYILDCFAKGKYQALVAIRCLDEGIDVPSARTAILMASTSNPREFIQRRGRILRRHEGKNRATIYDIIVLPPLTSGKRSYEDKDIEKKILRSELNRFKEFANDAENSVDCLRTINEVQRKLLRK